MEENVNQTQKVEEKGMVVFGMGGMQTQNLNSKQKIFTSITDEKILFNLDSHCDFKINDIVGSKIIIKDFLCKIIEKKLKEPVKNEETGEIKESEYTMITILLDEEGKSYVTASKSFYFQFKKLCQYLRSEEKLKEGIPIKIINVPVKNSTNKALGFELV